MITTKEKIINQLLGTVYTDNNNKSIYHVNMDNVLTILIKSGLIIPKKQYEVTLETLLNKRVVGAVGGTVAKHAMAEMMYNLAIEMALSKEEIIKYQMNQKTDPQMTD